MPLPRSPIQPLKNIIREGRQQVRKASDGIRSLADELHSTVVPETAQPSPSETEAPGAGASRLTSEEILAYQNREIGRELWALEKHLTQGCLIPDRAGKPVPCDCCLKGIFISSLAYEAISIAERAGRPSEIYSRIARWCEEIEPKVTVPAVESGQYDYKKMSGEASALRKELMGTAAFGALLTPKEQSTMVEKAAEEVEKRWQLPTAAERPPAVIPTEPRRRPRRETDLEYLADSPDYLAQTIDNTGYRTKLENAFQEAIARIKGLK